MPRMPRSPMSNGYRPGFATVQPAIGGIPGNVGGPSTSQAIARAADQVVNLAADYKDTQDRANQQRQDIAAQQAETLAREQAQAAAETAREQAAEQKRIGRLQAANAAVALEFDAKEFTDRLGEDVRTGKVKPEEFGAKQQEFLTKRQSEYRQQLDPSFHIDFDQASIRPMRASQIDGRRILADHQKDVAKAEISKGVEGLTRMALFNPDRALTYGQLLFAPDGDVAKTLGVDVAQKEGAKFVETAMRAHYLKRVQEGSNSGRALTDVRKAVSTDTRLDPIQQTSLLASIDSRMGVLEARGQAAALRQERQQVAAFAELQSIDAQGLPLRPDFVAKTMATLKGSPFEAQAIALVQGTAETAALGSKPLSEQRRILEAEFARARAQGIDLASSNLLQKRKGIVEASESAYRSDPWRAANERGHLDAIPPLDTSSLPAVVQSLSARVQAAPTVDALAGREVSLLRPEEANQLADTLSSLGIPEQTKLLGAMHEQIGPRRMMALSEQLKSKNDVLGIAAAYKASGAKTTSGVDLAELMMRGDKALKDKTVKVDEAAITGTRPSIARLLDGVYDGTARTDAAVTAAMRVWAGSNAAGKSIGPEEAVRLAVGEIVEVNGQKFPAPYGWSASQTKQSIGKIDAAYVEQYAGKAPLQIGNQEMLPEDVARMMKFATLKPAAEGRYAVQIGGRTVMRNGLPLRLPLPDVR